VQDAFVTQHARTVNIDDGTQEIFQFGRVKRAVRLEDKAFDIVIMVMVMAMIVVMCVIGVVMAMMSVVMLVRGVVAMLIVLVVMAVA